MNEHMSYKRILRHVCALFALVAMGSLWAPGAVKAQAQTCEFAVPGNIFNLINREGKDAFAQPSKLEVPAYLGYVASFRQADPTTCGRASSGTGQTCPAGTKFLSFPNGVTPFTSDPAGEFNISQGISPGERHNLSFGHCVRDFCFILRDLFTAIQNAPNNYGNNCNEAFACEKYGGGVAENPTIPLLTTIYRSGIANYSRQLDTGLGYDNLGLYYQSVVQYDCNRVTAPAAFPTCELPITAAINFERSSDQISRQPLKIEEARALLRFRGTQTLGGVFRIVSSLNGGQPSCRRQAVCPPMSNFEAFTGEALEGTGLVRNLGLAPPPGGTELDAIKAVFGVCVSERSCILWADDDEILTNTRGVPIRFGDCSAECPRGSSGFTSTPLPGLYGYQGAGDIGAGVVFERVEVLSCTGAPPIPCRFFIHGQHQASLPPEPQLVAYLTNNGVGVDFITGVNCSGFYPSNICSGGADYTPFPLAGNAGYGVMMEGQLSNVSRPSGFRGFGISPPYEIRVILGHCVQSYCAILEEKIPQTVEASGLFNFEQDCLTQTDCFTASGSAGTPSVLGPLVETAGFDSAGFRYRGYRSYTCSSTEVSYAPTCRYSIPGRYNFFGRRAVAALREPGTQPLGTFAADLLLDQLPTFVRESCRSEVTCPMGSKYIAYRGVAPQQPGLLQTLGITPPPGTASSQIYRVEFGACVVTDACHLLVGDASRLTTGTAPYDFRSFCDNPCPVNFVDGGLGFPVIADGYSTDGREYRSYRVRMCDAADATPVECKFVSLGYNNRYPSGLSSFDARSFAALLSDSTQASTCLENQSDPACPSNSKFVAFTAPPQNSNLTTTPRNLGILNGLSNGVTYRIVLGHCSLSTCFIRADNVPTNSASSPNSIPNFGSNCDERMDCSAFPSTVASELSLPMDDSPIGYGPAGYDVNNIVYQSYQSFVCEQDVPLCRIVVPGHYNLVTRAAGVNSNSGMQPQSIAEGIRLVESAISIRRGQCLTSPRCLSSGNFIPYPGTTLRQAGILEMLNITPPAGGSNQLTYRVVFGRCTPRSACILLKEDADALGNAPHNFLSNCSKSCPPTAFNSSVNLGVVARGYDNSGFEHTSFRVRTCRVEAGAAIVDCNFRANFAFVGQYPLEDSLRARLYEYTLPSGSTERACLPMGEEPSCPGTSSFVPFQARASGDVMTADLSLFRITTSQNHAPGTTFRIIFGHCELQTCILDSSSIPTLQAGVDRTSDQLETLFMLRSFCQVSANCDHTSDANDSPSPLSEIVDQKGYDSAQILYRNYRSFTCQSASLLPTCSILINARYGSENRAATRARMQPNIAEASVILTSQFPAGNRSCSGNTRTACPTGSDYAAYPGTVLMGTGILENLNIGRPVGVAVNADYQVSFGRCVFPTTCRVQEPAFSMLAGVATGSGTVSLMGHCGQACPAAASTDDTGQAVNSYGYDNLGVEYSSFTLRRCTTTSANTPTCMIQLRPDIGLVNRDPSEILMQPDINEAEFLLQRQFPGSATRVCMASTATPCASGIDYIAYDGVAPSAPGILNTLRIQPPPGVDGAATYRVEFGRCRSSGPCFLLGGAFGVYATILSPSISNFGAHCGGICPLATPIRSDGPPISGRIGYNDNDIEYGTIALRSCAITNNPGGNAPSCRILLQARHGITGRVSGRTGMQPDAAEAVILLNLQFGSSSPTCTEDTTAACAGSTYNFYDGTILRGGGILDTLRITLPQGVVVGADYQVEFGRCVSAGPCFIQDPAYTSNYANSPSAIDYQDLCGVSCPVSLPIPNDAAQSINRVGHSANGLEYGSFALRRCTGKPVCVIVLDASIGFENRDTGAIRGQPSITEAATLLQRQFLSAAYECTTVTDMTCPTGSSYSRYNGLILNGPGILTTLRISPPSASTTNDYNVEFGRCITQASCYLMSAPYNQFLGRAPPGFSNFSNFCGAACPANAPVATDAPPITSRFGYGSTSTREIEYVSIGLRTCSAGVGGGTAQECIFRAANALASYPSDLISLNSAQFGVNLLVSTGTRTCPANGANPPCPTGSTFTALTPPSTSTANDTTNPGRLGITGTTPGTTYRIILGQCIAPVCNILLSQVPSGSSVPNFGAFCQAQPNCLVATGSNGTVENLSGLLDTSPTTYGPAGYDVNNIVYTNYRTYTCRAGAGGGTAIECKFRAANALAFYPVNLTSFDSTQFGAVLLVSTGTRTCPANGANPPCPTGSTFTALSPPSTSTANDTTNPGRLGITGTTAGSTYRIILGQCVAPVCNILSGRVSTTPIPNFGAFCNAQPNCLAATGSNGTAENLSGLLDTSIPAYGPAGYDSNNIVYTNYRTYTCRQTTGGGTAIECKFRAASTIWFYPANLTTSFDNTRFLSLLLATTGTAFPCLPNGANPPCPTGSTFTPFILPTPSTANDTTTPGRLGITGTTSSSTYRIILGHCSAPVCNLLLTQSPAPGQVPNFGGVCQAQPNCLAATGSNGAVENLSGLLDTSASNYGPAGYDSNNIVYTNFRTYTCRQTTGGGTVAECRFAASGSQLQIYPINALVLNYLTNSLATPSARTTCLGNDANGLGNNPTCPAGSTYTQFAIPTGREITTTNPSEFGITTLNTRSATYQVILGQCSAPVCNILRSRLPAANLIPNFGAFCQAQPNCLAATGSNGTVENLSGLLDTSVSNYGPAGYDVNNIVYTNYRTYTCRQTTGGGTAIECKFRASNTLASYPVNLTSFDSTQFGVVLLVSTGTRTCPANGANPPCPTGSTFTALPPPSTSTANDTTNPGRLGITGTTPGSTYRIILGQCIAPVCNILSGRVSATTPIPNFGAFCHAQPNCLAATGSNGTAENLSGLLDSSIPAYGPAGYDSNNIVYTNYRTYTCRQTTGGGTIVQCQFAVVGWQMPVNPINALVSNYLSVNLITPSTRTTCLGNDAAGAGNTPVCPAGSTYTPFPVPAGGEITTTNPAEFGITTLNTRGSTYRIVFGQCVIGACIVEHTLRPTIVDAFTPVFYGAICQTRRDCMEARNIQATPTALSGFNPAVGYGSNQIRYLGYRSYSCYEDPTGPPSLPARTCLFPLHAGYQPVDGNNIPITGQPTTQARFLDYIGNLVPEFERKYITQCITSRTQACDSAAGAQFLEYSGVPFTLNTNLVNFPDEESYRNSAQFGVCTHPNRACFLRAPIRGVDPRTADGASYVDIGDAPCLPMHNCTPGQENFLRLFTNPFDQFKYRFLSSFEFTCGPTNPGARQICDFTLDARFASLYFVAPTQGQPAGNSINLRQPTRAQARTALNSHLLTSVSNAGTVCNSANTPCPTGTSNYYSQVIAGQLLETMNPLADYGITPNPGTNGSYALRFRICRAGTCYVMNSSTNPFPTNAPPHNFGSNCIPRADAVCRTGNMNARLTFGAGYGANGVYYDNSFVFYCEGGPTISGRCYFAVRAEVYQQSSARLPAQPVGRTQIQQYLTSRPAGVNYGARECPPLGNICGANSGVGFVPMSAGVGPTVTPADYNIDVSNSAAQYQFIFGHCVVGGQSACYILSSPVLSVLSNRHVDVASQCSLVGADGYPSCPRAGDLISSRTSYLVGSEVQRGRDSRGFRYNQVYSFQCALRDCHYKLRAQSGLDTVPATNQIQTYLNQAQGDDSARCLNVNQVCQSGYSFSAVSTAARAHPTIGPNEYGRQYPAGGRYRLVFGACESSTLCYFKSANIGTPINGHYQVLEVTIGQDRNECTAGPVCPNGISSQNNPVGVVRGFNRNNDRLLRVQFYVCDVTPPSNDTCFLRWDPTNTRAILATDVFACGPDRSCPQGSSFTLFGLPATFSVTDGGRTRDVPIQRFYCQTTQTDSCEIQRQNATQEPSAQDRSACLTRLNVGGTCPQGLPQYIGSVLPDIEVERSGLQRTINIRAFYCLTNRACFVLRTQQGSTQVASEADITECIANPRTSRECTAPGFPRPVNIDTVAGDFPRELINYQIAAYRCEAGDPPTGGLREVGTSLEPKLNNALSTLASLLDAETFGDGAVATAPQGGPAPIVRPVQRIALRGPTDCSLVSNAVLPQCRAIARRRGSSSRQVIRRLIEPGSQGGQGASTENQDSSTVNRVRSVKKKVTRIVKRRSNRRPADASTRRTVRSSGSGSRRVIRSRPSGLSNRPTGYVNSDDALNQPANLSVCFGTNRAGVTFRQIVPGKCPPGMTPALRGPAAYNKPSGAKNLPGKRSAYVIGAISGNSRVSRNSNAFSRGFQSVVPVDQKSELKLGFFASGFGSTSSSSSQVEVDFSAARSSGTNYGGTTGILVKPTPNLSFGLGGIFVLGTTESDLSGASQKFVSESIGYGALAKVSYNTGNLDFESRATVLFSNSKSKFENANTESESSDILAVARLRAGYNILGSFVDTGFQLKPFVGTTVTFVKTGASEINTGTALIAAEEASGFGVSGEGGVSISGQFKVTEGLSIQPEVSASVSTPLVDLSLESEGTTIPLNSGTSERVNLQRSTSGDLSYSVAPKIKVTVDDFLTLGIGYNGTFRRDTKTHTGSGQITFTF